MTCQCEIGDIYKSKWDIWNVVCTKVPWLQQQEFEDALQGALVKVLKKFDRDKACLKTYVINQIKWDVLHEFKVQKRREGVYVDEDDLCLSKYDEDMKYAKFFLNARKVIRNKDDLVVLQMLVEGYKQAEICKELGVTRQMVNMRTQRIRKQLEKLKGELVCS